MKTNINATILIVLGSMLPFYAHAGLANDIGNGVSDVGNGIGNAVSDVGNGVGNAISDIGNGGHGTVYVHDRVIVVRVSDAEITNQINAQIAAQSDIPNTVSVTTNNGIVVLSGVVNTTGQADRVIAIAAGVDGVRNVYYDDLTVANSTVYINDDSATTARVMGKIQWLTDTNRLPAGTDLQVSVSNGAVLITGSVPNGADIDVIKDAVSQIDGVKSLEIKANIRQ